MERFDLEMDVGWRMEMGGDRKSVRRWSSDAEPKQSLNINLNVNSPSKDVAIRFATFF